MIELLAPAGNMESVIAALRCGADAVYAGGKNFSARQNAANFDHSEMEQAIHLCHLYNARLYITVNTMLMDSQLDEFAAEIKKYAALLPDAFIVQDPGAALIIKSIAPDIHIHASTQMTVHSVNGALLAKKLGFSRVVISREASSEIISGISSADIDTEVFVHGALCMSVSGQCYMSAMIGSRSANRGLCAQSCRLPFSASSDTNGNCLSLKDLSLIDHIDSLKKAGVASLKIEGRMKRPEYVAAAVTAYRNAIDGQTPDTDSLKSVFSRNGFTDGYFTSKKYNMFGMRDKNDVISSASVIPELNQLYQKERKISSVDFEITISAGKSVVLKATDSENHSFSVYGSVPEKAQNKAISDDIIKKQLSKLGNTIYSPGKIKINLEEGLTVPASAINCIRRNAIENLYRLREQACNKFVNNDFSLNYEKKNHITESAMPLIRIRLENKDQISLIDTDIIDMIIFPMHYILKENNIPYNIVERIIIEPPRFITDERKIISGLKALYERGFRHIMCNNLSYIKTGTDIGFKLHGDFGLNIANSYSLKSLSALGLTDSTMSFELKLSQIKKIYSPVPVGIIAYGRLPLMLTSNCPIKNTVGCSSCKHIITDRTNRSFTVKCSYDYTEIFNPDTVYLADKTDEFDGIDFITLYFTDETEIQVKKIVSDYINGSPVAPSGITRGLYFRGIK